MSEQIKNVVLIGANGTLGPSLLDALLATNSFTITVFARESSKSTYPSTVTVQKVPDKPTVEDLIPLLKGQDALVVSSAGAEYKVQAMYAEAAARAQVKRFIPANFGSCDVYDGETRRLLPSFGEKYKVQELLVEEYSKGGMTWTNVTCGHLFNWGLTSNFLKFNLEKHEAVVFDAGDVKWSTTTTSTVGKAVVQILQKLKETENKMLYIQSFCVTQNEVLKALEKVTGKKWTVDKKSSEEYIQTTQKKMNEGDEEAEMDMVTVVGITRGNWEGKDEFSNGLLGLENEDLEKVVKEAVDSQ